MLSIFTVSSWKSETNDLPTAEEIQEVCSFVTQTEEHRIGDYFLRRGVVDVNNDGTPEQVVQGVTPTSGGDRLEFLDESGQANLGRLKIAFGDIHT